MLLRPRATNSCLKLLSAARSVNCRPGIPISPCRQLLTTRFFNTSQATMSDSFLSAVKARRTYYALEHSSTIPDEKIVEIVNQAVLHSPSSFNSQSTRVVVLLGADHQYLWEEIVKPAVKAVAPAEQWPSTEQKLNAFKAGYGSVRASRIAAVEESSRRCRS